MTPELDLIREAYPDADGPSAERMARLRATLVHTTAAVPLRRRHRWRAPAALAALAAAAVVAIVITKPGASVAPPGIETRAVLRGAAAGLAVPPSAVLHVAYTSVQSFSKGRATRSRTQDWLATSPPYGSRSISEIPGRPTTETAITNGRLQLYDRRRNTIYTRQSPPPYTVRPAPGGRYRLTPQGAATIVITAADLRGLRDGDDTIVWTDPQHPSIVPFSSLVQQPLEIRQTALALLRSPHPRVRRHARFAGRAAIEVSGPGRIPGSHDAYYVAPHTYHPLGVVHRYTGETVTVRFSVYQRLPATADNRSRVTLPGAHPAARIDTSAAGYAAAEQRLLAP
jgi:hypothetical protein